MILNLATALGIGMLIGAERERHKGDGPARSPAGIRTFTITSLAGAVAFLVGGTALLATLAAGTTLLAAVSYWRNRDDDPGLTTEIVLVLTTLLGGFSIQDRELAAAIAVTVTILLAARSWLHSFVITVMTEDEMNDALIFAGATLVVLPLVPDVAMGPYGSLNPHSIWILVILVMGISAAGYLAVRILGARFGLPIAGLASGFISSTATIGAMGARAAKVRDVLAAAVAGAVLSTVATVIQLALVVAATSVPTLEALSLPLVCGGAAAIAYGAIFTIQALRGTATSQSQKGRAFSISTALLFAAILSSVLVASSALREWFGERGTILAAALAGLVDTHSAAISVASLVASGKMDPSDAVLPILTAFSTNTLSKIFVAVSTGGRAYAVRVIPGLLLVAVAAWAGAPHILRGLMGFAN